MKHIMIATAVTLLGVSPLVAQTGSQAPTAPPAASAPASPTSASPAPGPQDGKPNAREVRATCRAAAKEHGLKGDAMRKAASDCVVKERPDLAGREQCRTDGFAKGLRKDELKAFVKDCVKNKG